MVVPPCLRSRLTAACRSVSTTASNSGANFIRCSGKSVTATANLTGANVLRPTTLIKINGGVNGSLRVNNYSTSTATATATTNNSSVNSRTEEDESLVEVLNGEGSKPKTASSTSSSSVNFYSEASDRAWSAFQALKSEKTPNYSDYLASLRQLSEARDFNRCCNLLNEAKSAGIKIDSEMFSLTLNSGRRTLRSNEIRELFGDNGEYLQRKSQGNDSQDSGNFSRSAYYEQFEKLVQDMKGSNVRPSGWFYEELANFLTAINQAGVLINLATAMEKRGETPSTKFYNRMLHCLPRCGLLDRASMLFNRMVLKGQADYYTYLVRTSSLVYVNQMEAARAVLSDMKGKFQMDSVAYNILIKSYLAQGNCEQAVQVFKQMTRDPTIAPNRVTCRTFLSYFYETANLTHSEPIVSYFEKANFPETFEDYGNVIKFFARYDPPKVLDLFKQFKEKLENSATSDSSDKNQIYHTFLRVLNDRQVTNDWKKSFANLILDNSQQQQQQNVSIPASTLNPPELPYHFRMIINRIESPDSVTHEIVLKKLIQLRRYDSVKSLYQSMFSSHENNNNVSVQPVHRNLYLTALLASRDFEAAREFISELHNRRIPISGKNTILLEEAGIELPRGALTAKKGQGVTANRSKNSQQQQQRTRNPSPSEEQNLNLI